MIDWERVQELQDEIGPEHMQEVIELFVTEVEEQLAGLNHALDIVDLGKAIHFLKGCSLNIGFRVVAKLCRQLEEEAAEAKEFANKAITENAELKAVLAEADAHEVFVEMSEGLTLVEQERFKVLSEKLNFADVDTYKSDLATLKESFFKKATHVVEEVTEEEEIITEDTEAKIPLSEHSSINALLSAFNTKQS